MNQAVYYYFVLEVARNFGQGEGFKSVNASHLSAFFIKGGWHFEVIVIYKFILARGETSRPCGRESNVEV